MSLSKRVLVPFTQGVEEIELIAVVDMLRRADIEVVMASLDGKQVRGRSGIIIQADAALTDTLTTTWDMLVFPGGLPNAKLLQDEPRLKNLAITMCNEHKYIAAICAAPAALASFGLLKNKQVTSHPSVQEEIKQHANITYTDQNVVEDGNIITSRGAGTAIEFALHLVTKLTTEEIAKNIKSAILA